MKNILRNIISVIVGAIIGSVVNMGIVMLSSSIIPLPQGVDMTNLAEGIKLFEPKHYIMPFLAHALGTFVGSIIAAIISKNKKLLVALIIGAFFVVGGILNAIQLKFPVSYTLIDLLLAYIPMAYLAYLLAKKLAVKK